MHPFRGAPDPIDRVTCGRCGHPVWDHCSADACAECERHNAESACTGFALHGFTELVPTAYEEFAVRS